jgi:Glyoxalase/Bleomycin resistance protein/Dioxygenase superfamily
VPDGSVLDEEGRACGDVRHAVSLRRDAEGSSGLTAPVREERDLLDSERLRPGRVRPDGVARDGQRPYPCGGQIIAPVPQEQELVRSGRRPVEEIETQQGKPAADQAPQRSRAFPRRSPDSDVGDGGTGREHGASLVTLGAGHGTLAFVEVERIAPIFPVHDLDAAMEHYRRLGFQVRAYGGGDYGFAARNGIEIHLDVVPDDDHRTSSAYYFVDDADDLAATWESAGVEVHPPHDTEWGQQEGTVVDPDGNVIRFGSPID